MEKRSSRQNEEKPEKILQIIAFNVGSEEFGVDIMQVQEIIRMTKTTRIPNSPDYVKGLINLRGRVIVVVDLSKRLGLGSKELDENARIIVVEVEDIVIGMIVNSVNGVLKLPESSIEPTPEVIASRIKADYIKDVGKMEGHLLIMLDLERVLTEAEIEEMAQISEMEE